MGRQKWTLGGRSQKAVQGKKKKALKLSCFFLFLFLFLFLFFSEFGQGCPCKRDNSQGLKPKPGTWVSHIVDRCFTIWATKEVKVPCNFPPNSHKLHADRSLRAYPQEPAGLLSVQDSIPSSISWDSCHTETTPRNNFTLPVSRMEFTVAATAFTTGQDEHGTDLSKQQPTATAAKEKLWP